VNRYWRKISLSAVASAVLLVAAVVAWSQQPRGPRPGGGPGGPPPGGFQGGPPPGGPQGPGRPGPGGPGGPRGFGPFGPFGRELNLTDDQRTQIQKIQQSFQTGDQALQEQMRTLVEGQGDPLAGGQFNEAAVRAAAEARAKIQVEMEVSHARMMSQMFGVLTDAQRAQLAAHREQMREQGPPPPPPPPQPPGDQPF
jgi:Spy/CpxP family protein refolding chaperone